MVLSAKEFEEQVADVNEREVSLLTSALRSFNISLIDSEKVSIAERMERVAATFICERLYKGELSAGEKAVEALLRHIRQFLKTKREEAG